MVFSSFAGRVRTVVPVHQQRQNALQRPKRCSLGNNAWDFNRAPFGGNSYNPAPEGAINRFVIANTAPQANLFHREQHKSPGLGMVRVIR
jgi:hypothetical protein